MSNKSQNLLLASSSTPGPLLSSTQDSEASPTLPISAAQRGVPNNHLQHWGAPGSNGSAEGVNKGLKEEEKEEYSEALPVPVLTQVEP